MLNKGITFLLVYIFVLSCAYAGELDTLRLSPTQYVVVDSIRVMGNDITQDFIITRELTFKCGDEVNQQALDYNRERVFSLRLFNNVKVFPIREAGKNIVIVSVNESWYIYPVPFLKRQNHEWSKTTYGVSLTYKNFRGRNETIHTMFGFGYDPTYQIIYSSPVVLGPSDISVDIGLLYSRFENKNTHAKTLYGSDFDYKRYSNSFAVGWRINQFNSIYGISSFDYVQTNSRNIKAITASGGNIDRALSLGAEYTYDSRNLKQYAEEGLFTDIIYLHKGFEIDGIDYNLFNVDFREYRSFWDSFTSKWRVDYRHTFGKLVPYYDYSFLGYGDYVRGHSNDDREGQNFILTSIEFSYPILKEWDLSLKLPLLPERLTSARIGIQVGVFADAGMTYNNGEAVTFNKFYSGYGVGVTLLVLPFNEMRFEYALDEYRKGEFLIGTGFSF